MKIQKNDALAYHNLDGVPGKIEVNPTKPLASQLDLALAYSPGVAEPCLAIAENPLDSYTYTSRGNLVAVISNGTAVLGLGNIGALASKPVMEGKGVLFKKFAGIDVFDIEVDTEDPDEFVKIVKALEPTFGGINLEDIKAPESFYIEEELKKKMDIPVMHDDQHGTAIISAAALLNALEITGKKIEEVTVTVSGAGASAIACAKLWVSLGVKRENLVMCDRDGPITTHRDDLDEIKEQFATDRKLATLQDALKGCDVFLGLSVGNIMTGQDVKLMGKNPIVFALSNPNPEIPYEEAMAAREDIIMATGRSDHPNQVNNVLGFPFIFRGALDVRATAINEEMKLAAVRAIAKLAKEPVPEMVSKAYGDDTLKFGPEYLIPKPLDSRLITTISPAVAKAAMDSGVARQMITDWGHYRHELMLKVGIDQRLLSRIITVAQREPKRIVYAEADHPKILQAAQIVAQEGIAKPILLGNVERINAIGREFGVDCSSFEIYDALEPSERRSKFADLLFEKRQRRGLALPEAEKLMTMRNYFGAMMVETGEADALISGLTRDYPTTLRPALHIIGKEDHINRVAGMYIIITKKGPFFFADTTVNVNPTAEDLVDIVGLTARAVRFFDVEPRIAMLSYSNFGSSRGEVPDKVRRATAMAKERFPDLVIDGEMQANTALDTELMKENHPFTTLAEKGANTLVFPDLTSGNIAYKLMMQLGQAEAVGPILMGMKKPVHVLQVGSSIREVVNMTAIAVADAIAQDKKQGH